jgi:hypothetical protein
MGNESGGQVTRIVDCLEEGAAVVEQADDEKSGGDGSSQGRSPLRETKET